MLSNYLLVIPVVLVAHTQLQYLQGALLYMVQLILKANTQTFSKQWPMQGSKIVHNVINSDTD